MSSFFEMAKNQPPSFNLVLYTNEPTWEVLSQHGLKPLSNIVIVKKPLEAFSTYIHKDHWMRNHEQNVHLNSITSWELNMLWSEKIEIVRETIANRYFNTEWHGWCDIGYFRNRPNDLHTNELVGWPDRRKIQALSHDHIVYACVNSHIQPWRDFFDVHGYVSPDQITFAGGFFLIHSSQITWWHQTYYQTLYRYFERKHVVKDDQVIVADCIFNYPEHFSIQTEEDQRYDPWFMFQRLLSVEKEVPTSTPLISILMPLYNGVEFLSESVHSVLQQSYPHWELLIGINGHEPTSAVYFTAMRYTLQDARIRVLDYPTLKSKSETLNNMVHVSRGSHIALLDVDDKWEPNKLSTQVPFLSMFDVVGTQCQYFGPNYPTPVYPEIPLLDITTFDVMTVNPIINSSAVLRKSLASWRPEVEGVEDYDLWIRLHKLKRTMYNCPEVLVHHRIHAQSAFNAKGNAHKVKDLLAFHTV